ncbi:hypothetical protein Theco_4091 (plasmid) [Thermobacillus composti KWC4]|jgi:hypothetical protein|uniref:Uncharacterized protein n=1 Tax=Thermobacillus composti (strain DSM 18247 / JCM 13945 / KWC4) TaxID=717605 RepID=L0ELC1_THECK|nr:hypothetical protein [Thermobacillus composti]AGA60090.1 hypothetical protein Theco_4091 [Thermobacillus composti KWC4]
MIGEARSPAQRSGSRLLTQHQAEDLLKLYRIYRYSAGTLDGGPEGFPVRLHTGRSLEKKGLVTLSVKTAERQPLRWNLTEMGKRVAASLWNAEDFPDPPAEKMFDYPPAIYHWTGEWSLQTSSARVAARNRIRFLVPIYVNDSGRRLLDMEQAIRLE